MITKRLSGALATAAAASLVLAGCATTGDEATNQAMGAGLGAALGCGVGALITKDARGCAWGAAAGAAVGFTVVAVQQYQARQVRSASADARLYGLTKPVDSAQVKIRKGSAAPKVVRAGQAVTVTTDYSLFLPRSESSALVAESWVVKKDGKVVLETRPQQSQRAAGGWQAEGGVPVPKGAPAGTYVVEHKVAVGSSYDTDESTFIVKS